MSIKDTIMGIFRVGRTSTAVTKRIIYDARTSPKARMQVMLIDKDDTIKERTFINSIDGEYIYDPNAVNNTYEKTKIYKRLDKKNRVISNVAVITPDYPTTIDFSNLRSDLGQLAITTVSKALYSTIIADSLGRPSDKEKKYFFAIGMVLGWIAGISTAYMFIRGMT